MEGGEGVEAFDVAALADAGDSGPIASEVVGMDLFDHLFAELFLGGTHAPGGLDARDGPVKARTGEPKARRHILGPLVLYDARKTKRAPSSDPEGSGRAAELTRDGVAVVRVVIYHLLQE
jgi:hypothetical protein